MVNATGKEQGLIAQEMGCPFYCAESATCQVNAGASVAKRKIVNFCGGEDYDFCPTYLGYMLAHSRPMRVDSDWLDCSR